MNKKLLSIFIALMLALSLCLVTAAPVAAEVPAILLSSTGDIGNSNADTIIVEVPAGTTLGQIDSIAWSVYLIQGYPPHVDIMLDGVAGAALDEIADEALVFEYANNDPLGTEPPTYGALTGAWYQTFSDGGQGPAVIDGAAFGWLATGLPGGTPVATPIAHADATGNQEFVLGTLADWQAGLVVTEIDADTIVLRLEIETDNYITDCVALVNNVVLGISGQAGPVEMTVSSPGEIIAISISLTSVDFGSLIPGTSSDPQPVTVTNTGNVAEDFSATIENASDPDVYTTGLAINVGSVSAWLPVGVAVDSTEAASLVLTMPSGAAAGTYTATLVFWAEIAQ